MRASARKCLLLLWIGQSWNFSLPRDSNVSRSGGLQAKILDFLQKDGGYIPTLTIAKTIVGRTASKKDVNPDLYDLEKQGLVCRNGLEWKAIGRDQEMKDNTRSTTLDEETGGVSNSQSLQEKIMILLKEDGGYIPTLTIAKTIVGPTASKKDVNPDLYDLEKQGLVCRNGLEWKAISRDQDMDLPSNQRTNFDATDTCSHLNAMGSGPPKPLEILTEKVLLKAMDGQKAFSELGESLKQIQSIVKEVEEQICRTANSCLANDSPVSSLELIGSAAYDIHIDGSDRDYVLRLDGTHILPGDWEEFAEQLSQSVTKWKMKVLPGSRALRLVGPDMPEIQIVPADGPFEYNKVPFSNLLARRKEGLGRDEAHTLLKEFFTAYPGAKHAARVAKAFFIPAVQHLPKQPWSLILAHMLHREASKAGGKEHAETDWGGADLFRKLIRDLASWPKYPRDASVGLVERWAQNSHNEDGKVVREALGIWSKAARGIQHKCMEDKM